MVPGVRWGFAALRALIPPLLAIATILVPFFVPFFAPHAAADPPARAAYVVGSSDSRIVRVDLETGVVTPGLATTGSTPNRIEASIDLRIALVANSGSDDVTVFDLESESVVTTVTLPAGTNPWAVEIDGARAFVTGLLSDTVHEIDLGTLTLGAGAATGIAPEGMCVAEGKLYVANTGFDFDDFSYGPGTVSVLDATTLAGLGTIEVATNPQECLVAPDGSLHVICTGDFFLETGSIHVIDPGTDLPVDTLAVAGYPGGGAIAFPDGSALGEDDAFAGGVAYLNVTTTAFLSEVWAYDAASFVWIHDGSNPLLPSPDFYGNLRVDSEGTLWVPDFSADLLIGEDPGAPGAPQGFLVGDGPIDLAIVEREGPVPLLLSGISAANVDAGIRLSWHAATEADVAQVRVARSTGGRDFEALADLSPSRDGSWLDRDTQPRVPHTYRVGTVSFAGATTWAPSITLMRIPPSSGRLTVERVFPNPARGATTVELFAPRGGPATLEIFDVTGARVSTTELAELPAGSSRVRWGGRDTTGARVAPGVYHARIEVGTERAFARILVVR